MAADEYGSSPSRAATGGLAASESTIPPSISVSSAISSDRVDRPPPRRKRRALDTRDHRCSPRGGPGVVAGTRRPARRTKLTPAQSCTWLVEGALTAVLGADQPRPAATSPRTAASRPDPRGTQLSGLHQCPGPPGENDVAGLNAVVVPGFDQRLTTRETVSHCAGRHDSKSWSKWVSGTDCSRSSRMMRSAGILLPQLPPHAMVAVQPRDRQRAAPARGTDRSRSDRARAVRGWSPGRPVRFRRASAIRSPRRSDRPPGRGVREPPDPFE